MIQTNGLCVDYGNQTAIRDASIHVRPGEIMAIVGPSGCGKSSFLMSLNRMTDLVSAAKVRGQVLIDNRDIHHEKESATELRRRVGMIFQKPNPFPMSIRKNIELALKEHGVKKRNELDAIVEGVLRDVGLWDEVKNRLNDPALHLSGGQQQRLCLARAIALKPQVLLMDEPCSALDPIASANVESLILKLRGIYTILIVTHNLAQARRLADTTAVFWLKNGAGEIIEQGPTDQVFDSPTDATAAEYLAGIKG